VRLQWPETWVLWIYASNEARFEHSVRGLLDQLKVCGRKDPDADVFQLLRSWLCDVTHGQWLLILDNADDASILLGKPSASGKVDRSAVVAPTSEARIDYVPRCNHGRVLVTSRTKEAAKELVYPNEIIAVGPMEEVTALALLRKKLGVHHAEHAALQLARELDFMPLALTQAAAYICQSDGRCSIQRYLKELGQCDNSGESILDFDERDLRRDRESSNSVMLTWQISFNRIRETSPSSADLLSLMSFFDRQAIPQALLLEKDIGQPGEEVDRGNMTNAVKTGASVEGKEKIRDHVRALTLSESGAGGLSAQKAKEFEKSLAVLRNYYFVTLTTDVTGFKMHGLVQLATKKWLNASGQFERWSSQFISNLNDAFPFGTFENWGTCRSLFPHVQAALDTDVTSRQAVIWQASLLLRGGQYASAIGAYTDAEKMRGRSLEARRKVLGERHPDTLISMHDLAETYSRQGRPDKTEEMCVKVIEKSTALLGERHPSTLASMHALADAYFFQGRYDEAEKLAVEVMGMKKNVLGEGHIDTLSSIDSLARILSQQGKGEEGENLQVEVLQKRKEVLGEWHPNTLTGMNNLASTYMKQGLLGKAEALQAEVTEKDRQVHGERHPYTLISMYNLAWIHMKQGRWEESEKMQVEVMGKRREVLGEGHPHTLISMSTLAYMLRALGRRKSALDLMSVCAQRSPDALGVDHHKARAYRRINKQWEEEDSSLAGAEAVCSKSDKPAVGKGTIKHILRNGFARFRRESHFLREQ
jgi:tetratricopeptide (TPR) repeat protein